MSHSDAMTKTNKRFRKFPSKHHLCCRRAAYIKIKFPVSFTICLLAAAWNFFEFQTEKGHRLAKSGDTAEDSNGTRWLGGSVFQYHSTRESWRATPPPLSCKSRIMFDQKMSQMKLSINSAVVGGQNEGEMFNKAHSYLGIFWFAFSPILVSPRIQPFIGVHRWDNPKLAFYTVGG